MRLIALRLLSQLVERAHNLKLSSTLSHFIVMSTQRVRPEIRFRHSISTCDGVRVK